jgi:lipopolysaccharide transport system ATP-binding protein
MSKLAIRVENLGKKYHIGSTRQTHSLRESIGKSIDRRLNNFKGGAQPEDADDRQGTTFWALRNVSFEIKRGDILGLIGRNGAGKSTLLKLLARITRPTEGCFEIFGRLGSLLEIGTGFHPDLTGRENVYLNGSILGMKRNEIEQKFDSIVDFSEIEQFIDTPVKYYSSGMYVRLAFAVAAHLDTEILLLDEVLSVGDLGFQKKSQDKIMSMAKDGRTVVLITHAMQPVIDLCNRAILLRDGNIYASGDIPRVIAEYETLNLSRVAPEGV